LMNRLFSLLRERAVRCCADAMCVPACDGFDLPC
jgi:hypothetical protein